MTTQIAQNKTEKIAQIITACNAKGIRFEYREAAERSYKEDCIGFYLGRNVWHWFEIYQDGYLRFDHSYSCNTGNSKKTWSHGYNIKRSLAKRLELIF